MTIWGRNIARIILERQGLRRAAVADAAGLSRTQFSDLINKDSNPEIGTLIKVATALGVPLSELFRDADGGDHAAASLDTRAFRATLRHALIDLFTEVTTALVKSAERDRPPEEPRGQAPDPGPDEPGCA